MRLNRGLGVRPPVLLRRLLRALCVLLLLIGSTPAAAQSSVSQAAIAEGLFQEGKVLLEAGRVAEACSKLGESQRLDPALGTLLNLAVCHEREGKLASAWSEFADAAALAERSAEIERRDFARAAVERLRKAVPRLTIQVIEPAAKLEVKLDGRRLGEAAWQAAIPLDPGTHVIEAVAPGRRAWSRTVVLVAGAPPHTVVIGPLTAAEAESPLVSSASGKAPTASAAATPAPQEAERRSDPQRTWALVAGGVGVGALGLGAYWGLRTLSKQKVVEANCDAERCRNSVGLEADRAAHNAATWANVSFGVGLAASAAGAYLLVTADEGKGRQRSVRRGGGPARVRLFPVVSYSGAVIHGSFVF